MDAQKNKNNKKRYARGEIAHIILKSLLVGGTIILVLSSPYAAKIVMNYFSGDQRRFMKSVGHLKKSKYVKSYYKNGKEIIEITEKGIKRSLQYDFEDMKIDSSRRWDGVWRIVTYDISEKRKRSRDLFLYKLKELGFYRYQKSLFIFPFACKKEIDFMREHLFLGESIRYIEATHVDDEDSLKDHFDI